MSIDPNSQAFSAEAARLLAIADSIDIGTVISRYAREHNTTMPRARAIAAEAKRFLVLCAMNAQKYSVGGEVDSFWHTFVLFTLRYAGFCQQVAGHFIHHVPADDLSSDLAASRAQYAATLRDYRLAFGEAPNPSIWPVAEKSADGVQPMCDVHDCTPVLGAGAGCRAGECTPARGAAGCKPVDCTPVAGGTGTPE